jgi:nitroreductase
MVITVTTRRHAAEVINAILRCFTARGTGMLSFEQLASSRRSIRKYENKDVSVKEVIDCVRIATTAPSGCNSQCWEFVLIHNKSKIDEIAGIVAKQEELLLSEIQIDNDQIYNESRIKSLTFFRNAPLCIAVYMTKMDYYDKKMEKALYDHGYSYDRMMELFGFPNILSLGAVIQNLLLALTEKGYGACWMNDPIIARKEISDYLGMDNDKTLISLIPVGIPSFTPKEKKIKDINEVLRIIE